MSVYINGGLPPTAVYINIYIYIVIYSVLPVRAQGSLQKTSMLVAIRFQRLQMCLALVGCLEVLDRF